MTKLIAFLIVLLNGLLLYLPAAGVRHHVATQRLSVAWMSARFAAQGFSEAILDWRHAGARGLRIGLRRVARLDRDPGGDVMAQCLRHTCRGYRRGALYALFCVARYDRHAPSSPDVAAKAMSLGSLRQEHGNPFPLSRRQLWRSPGRFSRGQTLFALLAGQLQPLTHGSLGHTERRGNVALFPALLFQVPGPSPTNLTPIRGFGGFHAAKCYHKTTSAPLASLIQDIKRPFVGGDDSTSS